MKKLKSRQIKVGDDFYYCDATDCDTCVVRYQCITSTGILETDKPVKKWRLRDGSSEDRVIKQRGLQL